MAKIDKKILIVEDDNDFVSILKMKFESEGFFVVTAQDGQAGASAAEAEKPDLVLSDVLLPKIDGIEMAKKIKESNKNVEIIFLTNIRDVDYIKKMEEAGGFDHMVKSDSSINDIVNKVKLKLNIQ